MPENFEFEVRLDRRAMAQLTHSVDMATGMQRIGYFAESQAKIYAPVRTGNLRRSIYNEVGRDTLGWYARFGTNVRYGIFQEIGTINHPPHPYLRPAVAALQTALQRGRL